MSKDIEIIFRACSINEEIYGVFDILNIYSWFNDNGYSPIVPKNPEIGELKKISLKNGYLEKKYKNKVKNILKDIYNIEDYKKGIVKLELIKYDILLLMPKFFEYKNLWKFKIHKKYQIILSLYGPGGSYNPEEGKIYMLVNKSGKFKFSPFETIIHEMVHIGIEDFICEFKLTHNEKERIVDLFCLNEFNLENYELQKRGDSNVDKFILENGFKNLPLALKEYLENYPR